MNVAFLIFLIRRKSRAYLVVLHAYTDNIKELKQIQLVSQSVTHGSVSQTLMSPAKMHAAGPMLDL